MSRYISILKIGLCSMLIMFAGLGSGAPGQQGDISESSDQDGLALPQPDAEGVIPSLVHRGDIAEFLRLLGVACQKNIVPTPSVKGPVEVNLFNVTCSEALNAVLKSNGFAYEQDGPFIYVYTQQEMAQRQLAARKMETRLFKLSYIPAQDVTAIIEPLMSEDGITTRSPATKSSGAGQSTAGSGEDWAVGNYIIVRDYPERLEEIATMIAALDQQPVQILVEATIMVASLDDTDELGIDFNVLAGANFTATAGLAGSIPSAEVALSGTETSATTGFAGNVGAGGLSIGIVKNNIGLFIEALESITDIITLGNPKVLTLNRQMGRVIVGRRDGYITTEVSQTSTTQTVEFLETGTQLSFRPFVADDGYIRMELNPKDSDGGVAVQGSFTLPWETTAEVTTNVLVKDGHTIVIGGLFRESTTISKSQIPLLGNVPLLGDLFRSTSNQNVREEVIFLITPHIVKEPAYQQASQEALDNCNRKLLGMREGMQWHSRDRLAAGHYQAACADKAAGDLSGALWHSNMASEVSPMFLDAQNLRDELLGEQAYCQGEYGSMRVFVRKLIEGENADVQLAPLQSFFTEPTDKVEFAEISESVDTAHMPEQEVTVESMVSYSDEPVFEEVAVEEVSLEDMSAEEQLCKITEEYVKLVEVYRPVALPQVEQELQLACVNCIR